MRLNRYATITCSATIVGLVGIGSASAQMANCGAATSRQMYQWCLGQQQQIYRQQQQYYNDIARQQWQQYQNAPRYIQPFRMVPGGNAIVGPATQAWRAPGYYYQYRYGRP